ncbi:MAG: stage III sporulation protein AB [Limnochordales bacterium]|nr:stage III sporulation protein AB [Limnochordales bacterium]
MGSRLGAALVLAAAALLGATVARAYEERLRTLRVWQGALSMLMTEIVYGSTPLPEALQRVARHTSSPVAEFLADVGTALHAQPATPAGELWRRAAAGRPGWCLAPEDEAVLVELGSCLGQSAAADQERHLRRALAQLAHLHDQAEAQRDAHGRLWRYLGLCAGGCLVLLLY